MVDNHVDLPSLEIVTFGDSSFSGCFAVEFESILLFPSSLVVDLPKLHTIVLNGEHVLEGNDEDENIITINGQDTYDNKLIMKSMLSNNDK